MAVIHHEFRYSSFGSVSLDIYKDGIFVHSVHGNDEENAIDQLIVLYLRIHYEWERYKKTGNNNALYS